MGALSEMAVAHPTAGSFGVYAELYLNRWAGFAMRYTYWAAQCIAIGARGDRRRDLLPVVVPETLRVAVDSRLLGGAH